MTRHEQIETDFRTLLHDAGLPGPDDVALLSRAIIFLWYDSKAFVLLDLDGMPPGANPLEGLNLAALRADILGVAAPEFVDAG